MIVPLLPWLVALAALPPALQGGADASPHSALAELGEGPLDNDVFLPVSRAAEQALARGDVALARQLRADPTLAAADERSWLEVLESWHDALAAGRAGESVAPRPWPEAPGLDSPWPDPDATAGGGAQDRRVRRTESLADAVVRRLLALPPAARRAWRTRFEPLADEALAAAGRSAGPLAEVERLHPGTRGAARAALARAELELEGGRGELARGWLGRAARHATLAGDDALAQAVDRRRSVSGELAPSGPGRPQAWWHATSLAPVAEVPLEDLGQLRFVYKPRAGVRVQPDGVPLEGTLLAVQTEERALVLDLADGRRVADFSPLELAAAAGHALSPRDPPIDPPGWAARPAVGSSRIVLALRSQPPALVCVRLGAPELFGGPRRAELVWAVVGGLRTGPGAASPQPLEGWPAGTLQPGPLVHGGTAYVQVHVPEDEQESRVSAHLVALDLADGSLLWERLVARGTGLARSSLRFLDSGGTEAVGQPLALVGDGVLVRTQLGAVCLVDACDGRPAWSFVYRRKPGPGDRWSDSAAAAFQDPLGVLVAPPDSDRAYWLRGRADLAGEGLLLAPALRIGEAEVLLGGDARRALVLMRSGRERALGEWDGVDGARFEAPWLGPGEVFTGRGAFSPARVLFATDRALYLHDRERELYLLDHASYPRPFPAPGGRVVASGDRVAVLGPHVAWIFEAR